MRMSRNSSMQLKNMSDNPEVEEKSLGAFLQEIALVTDAA